MIITPDPMRIKALFNSNRGGRFPDWLMERQAEEVRDFHMTLPGYRATPLHSLEGMANRLGVRAVLVKDESYRFGLNAFKALGAVYAMARSLYDDLDDDGKILDFGYLTSEKTRARMNPVTFVTATDGNHGRGVAWAASKLGHKAVVFMPKGSAESRVENIRKTGAEVHVTRLNYNETSLLALEEGKNNGWRVTQDTVRDETDPMPFRIMQGYITMISEALDQAGLLGLRKPTHLFLQCGLGSMPAGVLGYLVNRYKGDHPKTIVVEPHNAACFLKSFAAGDGWPHSVDGDMQTMMAGLACGEPNPAAWEILKNHVDLFLSCPDEASALGMRLLSNPVDGDPRIISGESGAVGVGLTDIFMRDRKMGEIKDRLGLNRDSVVLCLSTEGDTDPDNWIDVVHHGKNPTR